MGTIRILAINGGGIRGIIGATVLDAALRSLRAKDIFHLIAGTSTGGILACGLSLPVPLAPSELRDLYAEHGPEIFSRSLLGRLPSAELSEEKYAAGPLEKHLEEKLGNSRLSDIRGVDLIVPSYAIELPVPRVDGETRAPMFFRSWQAQGEALPAGADRSEYDFYSATWPAPHRRLRPISSRRRSRTWQVSSSEWSTVACSLTIPPCAPLWPPGGGTERSTIIWWFHSERAFFSGRSRCRRRKAGERSGGPVRSCRC